MKIKLTSTIVTAAALAAFFSPEIPAFAGRLYIKPELQLKRAERLISEADSDFNMGKIHLDFSPDFSVEEFLSAARKYKEAAEIYAEWGGNSILPEDIDDYRKKAKTCMEWHQRALQKTQTKQKTL